MSLRGVLVLCPKQSPTMRRLLRREEHPPRNDMLVKRAAHPKADPTFGWRVRVIGQAPC